MVVLSVSWDRSPSAASATSIVVRPIITRDKNDNKTSTYHTRNASFCCAASCFFYPACTHSRGPAPLGSLGL